jgi:hypothetical protein
MSVVMAISAFAQRSVRRRHAVELLAYSGGAVGVLLLFSAWICAQARLAPPPYAWAGGAGPPPIPWSVLGLTDIFAVGLLALVLFVLAPATVAATVAAERRAGTLDQLRTTPLDPLSLLAGLVMGAPARFYLLCAGPLALHLLCGLTGVIPLETLLATTVTLLLGAVACALVAVVVALAPRQEQGGAFVALGVAALIAVSGFVAVALTDDRTGASWAFLHPAGALNASMISYDGLWRHLSISTWRLDRFEHVGYVDALNLSPFLFALFAVVGSVLLCRAACRKLAAPHLPLFGKAQALGLFSLVAAGVILPFGERDLGPRTFATVPLILGMFLLPVMAAVGLFATPSFEAWALRIRSGRRAGGFSDDASPHQAVWAMLGVFVALIAVRLGPLGFPQLLRERAVLAWVWGCFTAATLPLYMEFAATRYQTAAARGAFGVAVGAHLFTQMIAIGLGSAGYLGSAETTFLELTVPFAILVPSWVLFRQSALHKRTLAVRKA